MSSMTESKQLTTADLANAANGADNAERVERSGRKEQESAGPLLPHEFSDEMRTRWENIQTGFVDDPRVAVQQADELVATAIKRLAESFAQERAGLEQQWSRGNDVSTEDLRQALRRYRSFFQRLLSV
jgi:hypothetical protein